MRLIHLRACRIAVTCYALFSSLAGSFSSHAQTTALDAFAGRDLWKSRISDGARSRVEGIVGPEPKGIMVPPVVWHVWRTGGNSVTRYVVLLGEQEIIIPGGSSACVALFDSGLKRIGNWCFQTGWRIDLKAASFEFSAKAGSEVIVLDTFRFVNGRNIAKEYFALDRDRLRLIRLENDKGEAVQNEYVYPSYEIGLIPPENTEDEWIDMLQSAQKPKVLSALVFLGGRHIREPQRNFVGEAVESKYADRFRQLIDSPRIRELIAGLTNSDNEWVRQAAILASRGPRERPLQ